MAYFANGSEGAILDNQCMNCLHGKSDDVLCPVASVQMVFNYDQTDNEDLEKCLNILIDKDGICQMRQALIQSELLKEED